VDKYGIQTERQSSSYVQIRRIVGISNMFKNYLKEVIFPSSLRFLSPRACKNLSKVETVVFNGSEIKAIENEVFYGCSSLKDIKIPVSVTNIGEHAFYGCEELSEIRLSENLRIIGSEAFANCRNLRSINVDENNQYLKSKNGVLYDAKGEIEFSESEKMIIMKLCESGRLIVLIAAQVLMILNNAKK
jgi:hypothetical protein